MKFFFALILAMGFLQAWAGDEAATSFHCATEADWKAQGCNKPADSSIVTAVVTDCRDIGGKINSLEGSYRALVIKCAKTGGKINKAAPKKLRAGQAPVTEDTSRLLEQNRALMEDCAKQMTDIGKGFEEESKKLEPKVSSLRASEKCGPKAQKFYQDLKQRADNGARMSKAKVDEYNGAGQALEAKRDTTKNNADNMGGDKGKASDKPAAGGGGGDPSSMMKALGDAAKMKQEADAKKAAEEKAAAEKEKARLAQEKANRITQCTANERDRAILIQNCKNDNYVGSPVISTQKAKQDKCIDDVNAARGPKIANCNAIP